jgi:CobQ/CobB/MinD/ParA nucleotide binding domain
LAKSDGARKLHFVLQGKGGVGKTLAALMLAQAIDEKGEPVSCIDTDPVNASLSSLSTMNPERVSVFAGKKVDTRALDLFTERLLTEDTHFVIDNGASSFVPVSQYLIENDIAGMMVEEGREPIVHCVVTGGTGMLDTMKGLSSILEDFPSHVRIVVWLNEFFGPIANAQGRVFEELPIYRDNQERISALVRLPQLSEEATSDMQDMIAKKLTFAAALARENTSILRVQKSRLFKVKQQLWPQIEAVI